MMTVRISHRIGRRTQSAGRDAFSGGQRPDSTLGVVPAPGEPGSRKRIGEPGRRVARDVL